ncbi:hypothetical protein VHEMI02613 [[Torrubiella] hemipterigena]|uniref:Carboxymuconolactone decarboxylase-like domain-containing protein n=1 Tax=[Torrubiella] hemipterigena TaxID=1531966 RepID=A0A0A1TB02_9HYPO|nr:hypothetical protein VHEMI02613 [[Torrubiella] hemipterigena]
MSTGNKELFEKGVKIRREVVGDEYVTRALENGSSEFAFVNQQFVTEYCWGTVWARDGLDRKQRSLLNLGILTAIKSWPELGVHVRGAINNGLTELEIREALLHAAVYCGAPAGMEAFKVAERVLNEMAEKGEHKRELNGMAPDAAQQK